ncbi:hypothetical protein [Stenotrophomonas sp. SY1]|uniref:hypothetical protein n=1 Tax=Stenotrophomonas sp. SY1 TaxID=477235 RepID=UPI001E35F026|nr:hypothetical protein [Stenotrophomonas sp. SY1]MCD9086757.1 hypothetical protein [Stenotrophomonas sp. SY1]
MSLQYVFAAALAAPLLFPSASAWAGASLVVDDATMTPHGHCQVESWARAHAPGQEFSAVPACNWGNTEVGLGLSHYTRPSHGPVASLGLKRLLRDFDQHDWGVGASFGASWDGASNRFDGWNLNLPASVAIDAQRRTVMHANLGWSDSRGDAGAITAGIGLEHVLTERWTLLGELYGDHRGSTGGQFGMRRAIGQATHLDLLIGHQDGLQQAPWLTVGLNVLLPN